MKIKTIILGMVVLMMIGGFAAQAGAQANYAEEAYGIPGEQRSYGEEAYDIPVSGGGTNPPAAGGGTNPPAGSGAFPTLTNPLKADNIAKLLEAVADILIFIGVIIAVFMFIFIGFKFVMAQGNEAKLLEARKWFLYAVIGTAILISSKVIVEVVKKTFISAGVVDERLFNRP